MRKASITIYLSLSLSIFIGFCLFLIQMSIENQQKIFFHGAVEIAMNSVLGEYSVALNERYGLFYVDTSYLDKESSVDHLQEQLIFYLNENMTGRLEKENTPWGSLRLKEVTIPSVETAAAGYGLSFKNQAVRYAQSSMECQKKQKEVQEAIHCFEGAAYTDSMADWRARMEQIEAIELPVLENEKGELCEVALANPADWAYGLLESDLLFLCEVNENTMTSFHYPLDHCLSGRGIRNIQSIQRSFRDDEEWFLSYLFIQMGNYQSSRDNSVWSCQLEYLLGGKDNDPDNLREVISELLSWRMNDNASMAFADGGLYEEALDCADGLMAVNLKPEFRQPVAESILYACAFLESISDVRCLLQGECVPLQKEAHNMSVEDVMESQLYRRGNAGGLSYSQYLAGFLWLEKEEVIILRTMDLMEMDIRSITQNPFFCMDDCVERFQAEIHAEGAYGKTYQVIRRYGYF